MQHWEYGDEGIGIQWTIVLRMRQARGMFVLGSLVPIRRRGRAQSPIDMQLSSFAILADDGRTERSTDRRATSYAGVLFQRWFTSKLTMKFLKRHADEMQFHSFARPSLMI